jgi:toxin ParE1/3/4
VSGYDVSPEARLDLLEIGDYVGAENPSAAVRLLDSFRSTFELLADRPGAGRLRPEFRRGLRSFPIGSYLVFYREVGSGVEIVRVVHGRRDLRRVFRS